MDSRIWISLSLTPDSIYHVPGTICHAVWLGSDIDWTVAIVTSYIFNLFIVCNTFSHFNKQCASQEHLAKCVDFTFPMRGKHDLADGVATKISLFLNIATQLSFSESWVDIILQVSGRPWEASKPTRKWYFILLFSESVDYIVYRKLLPESSRMKWQM